MLSAINRIASKFSYDALNPKGKRKKTGTRVVREDHHIRGKRRKQLQENAADLCRNMSLAGWMIRRHLDYVSQFSFHSRTENEDLDRVVESLMREDSVPSRADAAGKFGREKLFRLAEARRCMDGQTLLIELANGRLQGIQSDLIGDPIETKKGQEWVDGIRVGRAGRVLAFGIHRRKNDSETEYSKTIPAKNAIHYGFFDRYASDQVHGISPVNSALNPLRDVYENFNYALAKAKVSQLFALAFYREADESAGAVEDDELLGGDGAEFDEEPRGYKVDFGTGPQLLDLEPGDRAEFLESRQPSSEFQDFNRLVIQVALKAIDIPYSFYDESFTNFFGSRGAWLHYERACKDKRDDQIEMRRKYTIWKMRSWVISGRLVLPRGMTIADLNFEWVPRGMPWWDPAKEIRGHVQAVSAGLDNPQRICRATDTDFYDNVDQIAKAMSYAKSKGVPLSFAMPSEPVIEIDGANQ